MTTIVLHNSLTIGAILFALGAVGFLARRNLILMLLSAEMMLQGVALNFIAFGRYHQNLAGQSFTIFMLTIAACEAALALALVLALYQRSRSLDTDAWRRLGEVLPDLPEPPPPPTPLSADEQIDEALQRRTWKSGDVPENASHV